MFYEKIPEQPERFLSTRQIGILEEILDHTLSSVTFAQCILARFLKRTSPGRGPDEKR